MYSLDSTSSTANSAMFGTLGLIYLAVIIVAIIAYWKIFTKAGKPGWAAIVPIYNIWVLMEVIGRPGWWAIALIVVAFIPFIGALLAFAASLIIALDLAKSFGKSQVFGIVGLWLFSGIGSLILGFGDAKYIGPGAQMGSTPAGTNPTPPAPPAPPIS